MEPEKISGSIIIYLHLSHGNFLLSTSAPAFDVHGDGDDDDDDDDNDDDVNDATLRGTG
jgi:hypothetical protein